MLAVLLSLIWHGNSAQITGVGSKCSWSIRDNFHTSWRWRSSWTSQCKLQWHSTSRVGTHGTVFHSFYSQWMPWKKVEAKSNIYFFPGCWWNSWLNLLLSQGALKMCGCNDGAGKPVLLVSYNDNIVRLYDLPTYEFQHTILKLILKTLFLGGGQGKLPKYWA